MKSDVMAKNSEAKMKENGVIIMKMTSMSIIKWKYQRKNVNNQIWKWNSEMKKIINENNQWRNISENNNDINNIIIIKRKYQ